MKASLLSLLTPFALAGAILLATYPARTENLSDDEVEDAVRRAVGGNVLPQLMCFLDARLTAFTLASSCLTPGSKLCGWRIRRIQTLNLSTGQSCHDMVLLSSPDGTRHFYVDSNWRPSITATIARMKYAPSSTPNNPRWVPIDTDAVSVFFHTFFCFEEIDVTQPPSDNPLLPWNQDSGRLADLFVDIFGGRWPSDRMVFVPGGFGPYGDFDFTCCAGAGQPQDGQAQCNPGDSSSSISPEVIASFDPNEKVGPLGYGKNGFVSNRQPLLYSIAFENLPTATAPAQEVIVVDDLNTSHLDVQTIALGPMTFGAHTLVPPSGVRSYSGDVDLRPAANLLVRIVVSLNPNAGTLTWHFTSIDPQTGNRPLDPRVGFLPPNRNPPEGSGTVVFNVTPRQEAGTGTLVENRAVIVFDANEAIATGTWSNTIDDSRPQSAVLPLAAVQTSRAVTVEWVAADEGAGIQDVTLFVSRDNGPFASWQRVIGQAPAVFIGTPGHEYAFYSLARDAVGNVQESESPVLARIRIAAVGDLDADGDVDRNDLAIIVAARNTAASGLHDPRDLDGDGRITALDARKLVTLFTRPGGASK